jgi:4a-hydroxytetrahydrobiopterin dehydratase
MNELAQMHCAPITANTSRINDSDASQLKAKMPGWRTYEKDGEQRLEKIFQFADFNQAVVFTNQVAQVANEENHHPAILTEWGKVTVTWWTHKIKGLHQNDFIMAAKTEQLMEKTNHERPALHETP